MGHASDQSPATTPVWAPLPVAAERVSLCEKTLRNAITAGDLPGYRFGRALRVRLDELDAWAASKAIPRPGIDAQISRIVDKAPPLSPEQIDRLAELLRGAR